MSDVSRNSTEITEDTESTEVFWGWIEDWLFGGIMAVLWVRWFVFGTGQEEALVLLLRGVRGSVSRVANSSQWLSVAGQFGVKVALRGLLVNNESALCARMKLWTGMD